MRHILLCLFLCLFSWPVLAQQVELPTSPIGIEDDATQDAAIAVRIREILAQLEGYEDVTVAVSSGIVTLRGSTLDSTSAARLSTLVGRVQGVVAIENDVLETTDVARRLNPAMQRFLTRMRQLLAFLPLAAVALGACLVVILAGFALARCKRPWDRIAPNAFIADIYRQVIRLAFLIAGIVVALDILGATALLSTILGAAGIIGLAIGFAVKDTVENFIASVMLSIRQPFRPNDTVEIEGDIGNVIRLTSRATILLSFDGNHIRIPNATVFKSRIVNYTRNDERRFVFDFGLACDTDLAAATQIARDTLDALPFVLAAPKANAWIEDVGDSTITLRCAAWIAQHETSFTAARGEAIRLVKAALEGAGMQMPEPSFRLVSVPLKDPRHKAAKPSRIEPIAAAATEAQEVPAEMEQALERIVEEERASLGGKDLLRSNAREE